MATALNPPSTFFGIFRHDIFVVHVASHEEIDPGLRGELLLVDAENQYDERNHNHASLLTPTKPSTRSIARPSNPTAENINWGTYAPRRTFPFEELVLKYFVKAGS